MDDAALAMLREDLADYFSRRLVGQPATAERIIPFIKTYQAGLCPEHRPIGVFLLLGPTGTGKTRTVEVLAEALHGSAQRYLRIDCGEFQLDHEVAKLIGSPPGYLGHRETVPVLSKQKLAEAISRECDISIVLFDEIEKAAPALARLLLGVLDKGRLTLGDNSTVNFDKSLIFLTSNLGAREMIRELAPSFGFEAAADTTDRWSELAGKVEAIALTAVRKMFSPEFVNRIDAVITYQPLSAESMKQILDQQVEELQQHVNGRLGGRCFSIQLAQSGRDFLLSRGVSAQYGARELKRTVYRYLTQPLATMVAENRVAPGSLVMIMAEENAEKLTLEVRAPSLAFGQSFKPTVMIVDDNAELLFFLKTVMENERWEIVTVPSGDQALKVAQSRPVHVGLIDYMLFDLDGLALSKRLLALQPDIKLILMTGGGQMNLTEESGLGPDVPIIQKPFLVDDLLNFIRVRVPGGGTEETASAAKA